MTVLGVLAIAGVAILVRKPGTVDSAAESSLTVQPRKVEAVAALGQLRPADDVRRLAAPISGMAGTPRVASLQVKEGDFIKQGQVLAVFDNRPQIQADLASIDERIRSVDIEIPLRRREVARYAQAAREGAAKVIVLEEKQEELRERLKVVEKWVIGAAAVLAAGTTVIGFATNISKAYL